MHAAADARRAAELARKRRAAQRAQQRKELIQQIRTELTLRHAQRLMGTDPKLYPVIMMHAAIGGTFGPPVEMLIKFIPGIGEADMLLEGILGRGLITGRKLGTGERALNIFFGLLPVAGGLLSGGKAGAKAMANVVEATHIEPERLVAMLESAEHLDPRITAIVKKALNGATLTAEERNELLALRRTLAESGMVRRAGGEVEAAAGSEFDVDRHDTRADGDRRCKEGCR